MGRIGVVIPAKNESATIGAIVSRLRSIVPADSAIVVADDHSIDDTVLRAGRAGASIISLSESLGAWRAAQTGIIHLYERGYDVVITLDADGQHSPDSVVTLLQAFLNGGGNLIIGSDPSRGSALRMVAWKLMRIASGIRITDLTSGLRLYDRYMMALLVGERASFLPHQDIGVLVTALQHDLVITEVPVQMLPRSDGISRIFGSWTSVSIYMAYTLILAFSKRRRLLLRKKRK